LIFFIELVQIFENRRSPDVGVSGVAMSTGHSEFAFLVGAVFDG